jgi:hypothetical protein
MKQMAISIRKSVGSFAEDKDKARELRISRIKPALEKGQEVVLDFSGVEGATQSFVHALISQLIREFGADVLDRLIFKNCNQTVQKIISIVVEYMQESE